MEYFVYEIATSSKYVKKKSSVTIFYWISYLEMQNPWGENDNFIRVLRYQISSLNPSLTLLSLPRRNFWPNENVCWGRKYSSNLLITKCCVKEKSAPAERTRGYETIFHPSRKFNIYSTTIFRKSPCQCLFFAILSHIYIYLFSFCAKSWI